MRYPIFLPLLLLCPAISAPAQVSIGISLPGVSIGINQPVYPDLVPVPGYPVYYAPGAPGNYFFYDGMYWVYQNDNWYASTWYNGPWSQVDPNAVPLFILRVPVAYYRQPPAYFGGWNRDEAPRWGVHWGHAWEQRRTGWDNWDHKTAPALAPLPAYQRQYSGGRYPAAAQQQALHAQNYHYQPKEAVVRDIHQKQQAQPTAVQHAQPGPAAQHQPPVAQHPQPAAQHPQPVAQHPQPVAQHPQPVAQHQQPTAQHPQPVAQHQQPAPVAQHPQPVAQHPQPTPQRRQPEPEPKGKGEQHEPGKGPGPG